MSAENPRVITGLGDQDKPARPVDLKVLELDKRTYQRALECVHCGLCLPACPTYTQTGLEADSPRGRIYLMKGLADGRIDATDSVLKHLDLCLDCRACETACPSGVVYHELIEESREHLAAGRPRALAQRIIDWFFFHVFPYPTRLKLTLLPTVVLQRLGLWRLLTHPGVVKRLPPQFQKMQQMLPSRLRRLWESPLDEVYPATGQKKATAAMLAGCVGSVLFQDVNRQSIRLLQHAGCEVRVPRTQQCCGAIHHHGGKAEQARAMARANIDAMLPGSRSEDWPDFVLTNIAGCGAMLKDYAHLLRDDPQYAEKARQFVSRVRDISQALVELAPEPPQAVMNRTVTYHDACHLAHAQRVVDPPRRLLGWIKGLKVVPLFESEICCGAAGTYNLSQPEMARDLAERKLRNIQATGARICVTGNVGCALQIQSEAQRLGIDLTVVHPVTLLYEAYFGDERR